MLRYDEEDTTIPMAVTSEDSEALNEDEKSHLIWQVNRCKLIHNA